MIQLVQSLKQLNFCRKLQHKSSKSSILVPRPRCYLHDICMYSKPSLTPCTHGMLRSSSTVGLHATDNHNTVLPTPSGSESKWAESSAAGHKQKDLNLFTLKFHFLGDYVSSIRMFGCTDSFSTQLVHIHISACLNYA